VLSYSPDVAIDSVERKGETVNTVSSPSLPPEFELLMDKGFALAIQMLGCEQDASDVMVLPRFQWNDYLAGSLSLPAVK
jgi:hypothetical protein